jgi:hypothetical protein
LKLSNQQLENFVDVCSAIETVSNDIHIKNGQIKQFARRRSFIVHVDMESIFQHVPQEEMITDIKLSSAKDRLKVFTAFLTNESTDFYFDYDGRYYTLRDNISSFSIREPEEDALENKYDDNATPGNLTDDMLLFEFEFDNVLLKRLKTISEVCSSNTLDVKLFHNTGKAEFALSGSSKVLASTLAKFEYNNELIPNMDVVGRVSFDCMFYTDKVIVRMYKLDDSFVAFYSKMEIGGCPVVFYQRIRYGEIIDENNE